MLGAVKEIEVVVHHVSLSWGSRAGREITGTAPERSALTRIRTYYQM
jgi:hypothetical protein